MPVLTRRVRIIGLCLAGTASLIAGLLLAERIIQPGIIDDFGTSALVGLILMLVLPVVTAFALRHDLRMARCVVREEELHAKAASSLLSADQQEISNQSLDRSLDRILDGMLVQEVDNAIRAVRHTAHARPPMPVGRSAEGALTQPQQDRGTQSVS